jgi:acyl carrier protein
VNGNQAELVNIYGPTETTLAKFFYRINDENITANEMIPVGKPIPDTEVLIIKDNRQCGIGETGEVYIKTPFCSKGYYNDPALTDASFIQNPLVSGDRDIVYKSGDLGEFINNDTLRLVGRVDDQIKLYGNRVEINEIEVDLREHPYVSQAAVAAKKDPFGNLRLIGYIVPEKEGVPTVESLRRFLEKKLPDYMVPSMFVNLGELPLTHNQKINRRALPEPDRSRPVMEQAFVSPSSTLEKNLSAIWSKVLGLDRVGIHDNFFDLGGTSILSMHVSTRIQENIGIEIAVVKLFQYPTISSLAKYLAQQQTDQPSYEEALNRAQQRKAALARQRRSRVRQ